jgi:hypothetical protein
MYGEAFMDHYKQRVRSYIDNKMYKTDLHASPGHLPVHTHTRTHSFFDNYAEAETRMTVHSAHAYTHTKHSCMRTQSKVSGTEDALLMLAGQMVELQVKNFVCMCVCCVCMVSKIAVMMLAGQVVEPQV